MTTNDDEAAPLWELARLLAGGWRVLVGTTLLGIVSGVAISLLQPRQYLASTTLVPADSSSAGGALSALLDQVGGLASLAGLSSQQQDSTAEAIELVRSRGFLEEYIKSKNLLPKLFASKWNLTTGQWDVPADEQPTLWDGYAKFERRMLDVSRDKTSGIVTVTLLWRDRQEAADWLNDLVDRTNAIMRQRAIDEAQRSIELLEQEARKVTETDLRDAIYRLIEANIKQKTVASVREQFAFQVLDRAAPADPDNFEKPRPVLYVALSFLGGFLIGVFVLIGAQFVKVMVRRIQEQ